MSEVASPLAVAFKTLGCKVNQVESEAIAAELLGHGAVVVDEADASVIVVNTCTVTGEADAKARKAIRQALGRPGRPLVVVTGCLASLDAEAVARLNERVVVESDKERVAETVGALLGLDLSAAPSPPRVGVGFRTRAMLKIEDGCDAFCSYCIVPYARGVPRGVALKDVVAEAQGLVAAGVREIVLTGINVGRYRDATGGGDLAALISAVAATGIERLRLSSVEPRHLTERFLATAAETPAFCRHLHVPLQSGSDAVLSAMRRDYTASEYASVLTQARRAIPQLAVTTDVIAGFPGETADQAVETLAFCEGVGFRKMHVFRYSRRARTPAAERVGQIAAAEKNSRAAALRELSSRLCRRDAERCVGERRELLVERVEEPAHGERVVVGTTEDYLRVRVRGARGAAHPISLAVGDLVDIVLTEVEGECVLGVLSGPPTT